MSERFDGTEHPHVYARLGALMNQLQEHGLKAKLTRDSLIVSDPIGGQVSGATVTVTCKPQVTDCDRLWFVDGSGEPIEQADNVIDAAVIIVGYLTPAP